MEHAPRHETQPSHLDRFPTTEDWVALQGGKPRVFRHGHRANVPWRVIHVYEEHADAEHRFQSGAIVETTPPQKIAILQKGIYKTDPQTGRQTIREIAVPSFMDRTVHGDVCEDRSGYRGYDRITNQTAYEAYLEQLRDEGWEELRFGVSNDGFTLTPLSNIRPAYPLET
jgi:hypothetical protein